MSRTLTELQDALAAGRTTSVALTEDALGRAQASNGEGARVFIRLYAERALKAARASDALRQAGFSRSPVEGLPISIKDLFDVAGDITLAGSAALDDTPPVRADSPVVQRLVAAGAVIVGRTNMTEFMTVAANVEAALGALSCARAQVSEIAVPEFAQVGGINAKGGLTAAEAWHWHREPIERAGGRYDPRVRMRIERGREMSAADYIDVVTARAAWIGAVEARIAPFDALIMPTAPIVAPRVDELADDAAYGAANLLVLRNPTFINFLDGCALSVPCHRPGEAPIGLMIAGSAGRDRAVLSIGRAVEETLRAANDG